MWYKKLKTIGEKYQVPFLNFNFIDFFNIPWIWSSVPSLWVFDTMAYWLSICRNLVNSSVGEIAYPAITVLYFFKRVSGRRLFRLGRTFLLLFPYLIAESWDPNPRVDFFIFLFFKWISASEAILLKLKNNILLVETDALSLKIIKKLQ